MRHSVVIVVFIASVVLPTFAQEGKCTEEFIKAQAQKRDKPETDDLYFFSAAYNEPVIGKESLRKAGEAVVAKRKNLQTEGDKPVRIVVAPSGDMAYEYGTRRLSFDEIDSGKHYDLTNAYLRVWRVDSGECKTAAFISQREGQH